MGGKPALFVSFGNANGARSVQQVKQVMGELRMMPIERPRGHALSAIRLLY